MLQFLKNLVQVMISPDKGWEDVAIANLKADIELFPRYVALAGITAFTGLFAFIFEYPESSALHIIMGAVITFLQYIIGYFISFFIFVNFFRRFFTGGLNENKVRTFCIYCLSIFALFTIISNIIPQTLPIMQCLNLYIVVVVWKSCRYMLVEESNTLPYIVLSSVALFFPQFLIGLMSMFI